MLEEFLKQFPYLQTLASYGIFDIAGVAIGAFIAYWFVKSDRQRRKREEEYYEMQTKSNTHEILKHFVEIDRISKNDLSDEEEDVSVDIDPAEVLTGLNQYYKRNNRKMEMLLENTKTSLARWGALNSNDRTKYNKIITDFEWLTKEYFSIYKPLEIQTRMWDTQRKDVTKKRYEIDTELDVLIK
ncbi:hypothetical protein [Candidatus Nitrosotenuis cloacae]|uniref:Uncharacterized protein n=1 Tax=Candidatus Nitrosotenuis cloacae TaxID=1603555 RepID=A0A3G1B5U7_9ARCH|nr:hypothetical protein [Candidatus Nitrosotenuis cloacae]AJZ76432.1 hypothetical protein SU86_008780 [Candidatus Nitrosotenuis cloacae]